MVPESPSSLPVPLPRLLVVEDDAIDRMAFIRFASQQLLPYQYDLAVSVEEARSRLGGPANYDAVVADYHLGDGTVFDFAPSLGGIPLIVVTASGSESVAAKALQSGASDYLVKDPEGAYLQLLPHSLDRTLALRRLDRERSLLEKRRNQLMRDLEIANRDLKDFAHVVSHDLKAPLRAIRALSKWLVEDYGDRFDAAGREKVMLIADRVQRMHDLIDGILAYSSVGVKRERMETVDLGLLVAQVIDVLAPPSGLVVRLDPLPKVTGDRVALLQIFQNLLSNAINFMDKPEGRVAVHCETMPEGWIFTVEDNGPGIEPHDQERVFQPFQTLGPRNGSRQSNGIGLTIVRKLVQMHGGRIWIESDPGRGSRFRFTFPSNPMAD